MTNAARTIVEVAVPPLAQPLSYLAPASSDPPPKGTYVSVPLGRRRSFGYVVGERPESDPLPYELKAIFDDPQRVQVFHPDQLPFFRWIAEYYSYPLSQVLETAIPSYVPPRLERQVTLRQLPSDLRLGPAQRRIIEELTRAQGVARWESLQQGTKSISAVIHSLEKRGIVSIESTPLPFELFADEPASWAKSSVALNAEQTRAATLIIEQMHARQFSPFLLHGITGSGKTEVYLEAIEAALRRQLGVLVLVPEIALTPQLVDRFRARLGNDLALLHSALPPRTRWESWQALLRGSCRIAIGARSAIFAPVQNLGLIIVDEEHDGSYKQSDSLRYHGRDLAVVRAKQAKCPVVLGSATPSIESYFHASSGKYQLLSLPLRAEGAVPPSIEVVDLARIRARHMPSENISPRLKELLDQTLATGGQTFIMYNRRGFASFLQCEECDSVVQCPNCTVTLTYHQNRHKLLCHYCGLELVPFDICPTCTSASSKSPGKLLHRGAGTEKVLEELQTLYPTATIERMDRDAVDSHDRYRSILQRMRNGEIQILVGTQMIAKGHDFPGVTLVGIIDCDIGLHMPDFRASERVFQLLTQAAGRAGRGERRGQVVLQTRSARHPSLQQTVAQDYIGFASHELEIRKGLRYPPFSRLLRIVVSCADENLTRKNAEMLRDCALAAINQHQIAVQLVGAAPAPLQKLKTLWRWHLLFRAPSGVQLNRLMRILQNISVPERIRVTFDIDPQEML